MCYRTTSDSKGLLTFAPALALALASLAVVVAIGAGPRTPRQVAAVFPPWWTPSQSMAAASSAGAIIAVGGASNVIIVAASDGALPARLNAAGALLQLDPQLTGLCAQPMDDSHV